MHTTANPAENDWGVLDAILVPVLVAAGLGHDEAETHQTCQIGLRP